MDATILVGEGGGMTGADGVDKPRAVAPEGLPDRYLQFVFLTRQSALAKRTSEVNVERYECGERRLVTGVQTFDESRDMGSR